jgi:hypothetical protein
MKGEYREGAVDSDDGGAEVDSRSDRRINRSPRKEEKLI